MEIQCVSLNHIIEGLPWVLFIGLNLRVLLSPRPRCSQITGVGPVLSEVFTNQLENVPLEYSEDCLYLNIYSPTDLTSKDRLPVSTQNKSERPEASASWIFQCRLERRKEGSSTGIVSHASDFSWPRKNMVWVLQLSPVILKPMWKSVVYLVSTS